MKKTALYGITILIIGISAFANNVENKILINTPFIYSPTTKNWSQNNLLLTQNIKSDLNEKEDNEEVILKSNFEFIKSGRLIGIDNNNFKYYEIIYENENFVEKELSYEETEKIFPDIELIKISDFIKGTYTIIGHGEAKDILIFNDTNENFEKYTIKGNKKNNSDIKGLITLPCRGKIEISNNIEKESKKYLIKVR